MGADRRPERPAGIEDLVLVPDVAAHEVAHHRAGLDDQRRRQTRHRVLDTRPGLQSLRQYIVGEGEAVVPDEAVAGADRYLLFEAVSDLLAEESAALPVLLVLDDVQWADLPTLRLLQHVVQHQRPGRLLLLAPLRTVPTVDNADLDVFLAELHRDRLLVRAPLDGLTEAEVGELLSVAGTDVPPSQLGDIHLATRGNPFFVTELAEHGDVGSVPASVRDVLGARMQRMGADALRLLGTASVAGSSRLSTESSL